MNKNIERLYNGIVKENPTFVMMLGMCPTLAVTTSAMNGLGMGLTTTVILTASNMMISLLRKVIPDKVRIPAFIVVVASFVTIVQFLLQAYLPSLNDSLGIYIPLIVVNCIILGRAESYASKNPVVPSMFDGIGMGLGFTVGLTAIGIFRELLGAGTAFGLTILPAKIYTPITIFVLAPGAFFVLAGLIAIQNYVRDKKATNQSASSCRTEDCANCTNSMCGGRIFEMTDEIESVEPETKKVEDKKVEEKKPEAKKVEEMKPEAKKAEEKKPEAKKAEEKKPEAKKAEEKKPEAKKAEEKKPEARKAEEKKPEAKKAEEKKPEAKKAEEKKPEAKKAEEKKPEAKKVEEKKNEKQTPDWHVKGSNPNIKHRNFNNLEVMPVNAEQNDTSTGKEGK